MKTEYILLASVCIVTCINLYLNLKKSNANDLKKELKKQTLMLILYAEKQNWINEDKFKFVVKKICDKSPETVRKIIKEETIEKWVLKTYNEYKAYMKEEITLPELTKKH